MLGFCWINACDAYRQPDGMLPPNTAWVSLSVRVSEAMRTSFFCVSIDTTGSRLAIASIWPERIAATAPALAPTPMNDTSEGFSPYLASTKLAIMLVDEPGAVTPIFLPFRSAIDLKLGMVLFDTTSTICGARPCSTNSW